jgi:hypothetical protein
VGPPADVVRADVEPAECPVRGGLGEDPDDLSEGRGQAGSLLGGLLGELIGLRGTLLVGAIGILVAPASVLGSSVPRMRRVPDHVDMEGAE